MKVKELAEKIKKGQIDPSQVGRTFFEGQYTPPEKASFLRAFLETEQYEELGKAIHAGLMRKEYNHSDFVTANTGVSDLDARYFHLLLEVMAEAELSTELLYPLFIASYSARSGSALRSWNRPIEAFLLNEAYRDYERVLTLLTEFDAGYSAFDVLFTADRKRTETVLVERLLYGDGKKINFSAIRKLLLAHKIDVSYLFGPGYADKDPKVREAIVRLALLYKNDSAAAAFLARVADAEPNGRIRELTDRDPTPKKTEEKPLSPKEELESLLVTGTRLTSEEFLQKLSGRAFSAIADNLFFSVYDGDILSDIVVTHKGGVFDLDNNPYPFCKNSAVSVIHPAELPRSFAFIKSLNIPPQPFLQIHRPVYVPGGMETASNVVSRLSGTVMTAGTLQSNLKSFGFRLLHGRRDSSAFSRAAIDLAPYSCAVEFSRTDFSDKYATIRLGDAKFYLSADFVRLGGKTYAEGVPSRGIGELPPRVFSEFVYALYRLGNIE